MSLLGRIKHLFSSNQKLSLQLKNLLGFYPDNIHLYTLALKHRSTASEQDSIDSNERLEYLGDAILGAIVANFLFKKFPYKDEGFLTKMRSRIVNRKQMNFFSVKLGLDKMIVHENHRHLYDSSMKGDAMEALIGAIYLDKGFEVTKKFIVEKLLQHHLDIDLIENTDTDYKSKIVEWCQKNKKEFTFVVEEESGKYPHKWYNINLQIGEEVVGSAKAHSKKGAEQQASQIACDKLEI